MLYPTLDEPCPTARASCPTDAAARWPAALALVAWVALFAYADDRANGLPAAARAVGAGVALVLLEDARNARCDRERRFAPSLATPALLLSIFWSTSPAMRRLARTEDGISDAALPFVAATLAGASALLMQPAWPGACASATRRAITNASVGAFLAHAATSASSA